MGARTTRGRTAGERLRALPWHAFEDSLNEHGWARIPRALDASQCATLRAYYDDDERFRSTVDMERHRFGRGEYKYFADPLPPLVRELRKAFYPHLARIANRWEAALGRRHRFPTSLTAFTRACAASGQERPTPLLLRYEGEGYNCLHQDLYGDVAFPLQVAFLLSRPGADFEGGEFLLVEQRPRAQSRGDAFALARGEAIIFPNRERPVRGARGFYRVQTRHGVSRVQRGKRMTFGLIFHNAR